MTKTRAQMHSEHEKKQMKPEDILELLDLEDWNQADLAEKVGVTHVTMWRWIEKKNSIPKATQMLLKQWLDEARKRGKVAAVKSA